MPEFRHEYLADMRTQFAKLRGTAERAMAQVGDADFARMADAENNSIAIIVKHISGNLRSRCTTSSHPTVRNPTGTVTASSCCTRTTPGRTC